MTAMPVMPHEFRDWTADDLDQLPDDGLQYELLLVGPAPLINHQRASVRLVALLVPTCPPGLEIFHAPVDWQLDLLTSFQPDLLVVRLQDVGSQEDHPPATSRRENFSPSTRRKDLFLKTVQVSGRRGAELR